MTKRLLLVQWQWAEGTAHAGVHFFSCHDPATDGRIHDWTRGGELIAIAATAVDTPAEGDGLALLAPVIDSTAARRQAAAAAAPKTNTAEPAQTAEFDFGSGGQ